ncbi:MAG: hypothetical protein AB7N54_09735 [Alphaproteobacteria bacterium]
MIRYVLVRHSRPFLAAMLRAEGLARLSAPLVDALLSLPRAAIMWRMRRACAQYRVEQAHDLPLEISALPAPAGMATGHRSPTWLAWLFAHEFDDVPSRQTRLLVVRERRDGAVLGHVLVKAQFFERATQRGIRDVTIGSVQDWLSLNPERLSDATLVWLGIGAALELGTDAVEVCTADAALGRILRGAGLVRLGALDFVWRAAPGTALAARAWRDPARWRLRPAESDNFFT